MFVTRVSRIRPYSPANTAVRHAGMDGTSMFSSLYEQFFCALNRERRNALRPDPGL